MVTKQCDRCGRQVFSGVAYVHISVPPMSLVQDQHFHLKCWGELQEANKKASKNVIRPA